MNCVSLRKQLVAARRYVPGPARPGRSGRYVLGYVIRNLVRTPALPAGWIGFVPRIEPFDAGGICRQSRLKSARRLVTAWGINIVYDLSAEADTGTCSWNFACPPQQEKNHPPLSKLRFPACSTGGKGLCLDRGLHVVHTKPSRPHRQHFLKCLPEQKWLQE